jgi:hypothetical protein
MPSHPRIASAGDDGDGDGVADGVVVLWGVVLAVTLAAVDGPALGGTGVVGLPDVHPHTSAATVTGSQWAVLMASTVRGRGPDGQGLSAPRGYSWA